VGHGDGADDDGESVQQVGQVQRLPEVEQDRHQEHGDQPDDERHPAVDRLGVRVISIVKPPPAGRREKQPQNQQDLDLFLHYCPPFFILPSAGNYSKYLFLGEHNKRAPPPAPFNVLHSKLTLSDYILFLSTETQASLLLIL
jgi:hypothetical protein